MKKSLLSGAAFLCAALLSTSALASKSEWTPAPERWNATHTLKVIVVFDKDSEDCTQMMGAPPCQYTKEVVQINGENRTVYRETTHRMIVDPWFDYLNALFRLSNIPIRADLADVFLLDRPMEGTGDSMINSMGRDRLLRHFMNRTGAHEVILVTKRNQPAGRCGLHNGGDRTGLFKPFGWVARVSFGCSLWGAEGKRTFAHEIGHGMGLDHTAAEGVMTGQPAYASAGETSSWGTIMKTPKWFGWTRKDTFSDMNRKCDKSTTCGGSNKADAARYLRETLFKYTPIPVVQFKSKTNGQCLDIRGGVKNGNALMTQACSGSVSQQFRWVDNGAIVVDGLCLEVKGGVDATKTPVVVNPCDGGDKQRWMESGGRILSWNGSAGRCLDLATEHNNAVLMWTCHPSHPDQRFAKVPK